MHGTTVKKVKKRKKKATYLICLGYLLT